MNPINTPPETAETSRPQPQPQPQPQPIGPLQLSSMRLPPPRAPKGPPQKPRLQIAIRIEEPPSPSVVKIMHFD